MAQKKVVPMKRPVQPMVQPPMGQPQGLPAQMRKGGKLKKTGKKK